MAASKQEFYESINEDTFAGAEFCKKLYGYCLYDDTFLQKVMDKFESYGRGTAVKTIFSTYVSIYLHFQMEKEKEASMANSRRIKKEREEHERKVKQEEWKKKHQEEEKLRQMSDQELIELLGSLTDAT